MGRASASSQVMTACRLSSRCAVKNTSTAAPQAMASGMGSAIQNTGLRSSSRSRTVPPPMAVRLARKAKPTNVELRTRGRQRTGQGEDQHGGIIERGQDAHLKGFNARPRQLVRAFVLGVAGMALDPFPRHPVARLRLVEAAPEILVLDGFTGRGLPAVPLPAVNPAGHAVLHIGTVGHDGDGGGALQRLQRRDGGEQLHPVVGRVPLAAVQTRVP